MKAAILALIFLLQAVAPRGQSGVITGTVRKQDGSPTAGVRVVAITADGAGRQAAQTLGSLTQTDATGAYRLEGVPPGRYWIATGPLDFPLYHPGVRARESAQVTVVAPGATITNVDFVFNPEGVRVRGRVEGDAPLPSFIVTLNPISNGSFTRPVEVKPDGTFEIAGVKPGSYVAQLSAPLHAGPTPAFIDRARKPFAVGDLDVEGVTLTSPLLVFGRVELEPGMTSELLKLRVLGDVTKSPRESRFTIAADRRFMAYLTPGDYWFDVAVLPIGYAVQSMSFGERNLSTETLAVPARLTGREPEIRVSLKREQIGVTVSGRITRATPGDPLPKRVVIERHLPHETAQQRIGEAPVSADGAFEFTDVAPGNYSIHSSVIGSGESVSFVDVLVKDRDITDVLLPVSSLTTR